MKKLMYLFIVATILIAGCDQDDTLFENQDNLELKKAKVPIPMKADLYAVPDLESALLEVPLPWGGSTYVPSKMIISGTGSHIGRVNAKKSFYEFKSIEFSFENEILFNKNSGTGLMVGANGDSFEYTWWIKQNMDDGSYFGEMDITPGSGIGKFKGSSGSGDIVGGWNLNGEGVWFKIDGYLVYE